MKVINGRVLWEVRSVLVLRQVALVELSGLPTDEIPIPEVGQDNPISFRVPADIMANDVRLWDMTILSEIGVDESPLIEYTDIKLRYRVRPDANLRSINIVDICKEVFETPCSRIPR